MLPSTRFCFTYQAYPSCCVASSRSCSRATKKDWLTIRELFESEMGRWSAGGHSEKPRSSQATHFRASASSDCWPASWNSARSCTASGNWDCRKVRCFESPCLWVIDSTVLSITFNFPSLATESCRLINYRRSAALRTSPKRKWFTQRAAASINFLSRLNSAVLSLNGGFFFLERDSGVVFSRKLGVY